MKTLDKRAASALLREPDTLATTIHVILLTAYPDLYGDPITGEEPLDPLEIYARVLDDFNAVIPEEGENRINALLTAVPTDLFYQDPLAFQSVANALYTGDIGDLVEGFMDDLTVPEILWSIYEVGLNRGDEIDFSPAVQRLIDAEIASEAQDMEEDVDEIIPYYARFVEEMKKDLTLQLRQLGVGIDVLSKI
jgi:hypothetical protein